MPFTRRVLLWLIPIVGLAGLVVGFAIGTTISPGTTTLPSDGVAATPRIGVQICETELANAVGRDKNGCWFPGNYFEAPPEVIPQVKPGAPLIRLLTSGQAPMTSLEGTLFFIRAVSPIDRVVLARQWTWPGMEQRVPAGAYQVTIYARPCDANCGNLDPTVLSCTVDMLAEPATTKTIRYHVDDDSKVTCELDQ